MNFCFFCFKTVIISGCEFSGWEFFCPFNSIQIYLTGKFRWHYLPCNGNSVLASNSSLECSRWSYKYFMQHSFYYDKVDQFKYIFIYYYLLFIMFSDVGTVYSCTWFLVPLCPWLHRCAAQLHTTILLDIVLLSFDRFLCWSWAFPIIIL